MRPPVGATYIGACHPVDRLGISMSNPTVKDKPNMDCDADDNDNDSGSKHELNLVGSAKR